MNQLVAIESMSPLQVFSDNGLDPLIEQIEREARSILLDISSEKGRKEVASLAHKIAKSKTALDKMGKDLVSGWKEQAKKVDVERARAWDRLEALQKEIRQPLTDWEDCENERIAKHEANLAELENAGRFTLENWHSLSVEAMTDRLKEVEGESSSDWEEFCVRAKLAIEQTTTGIRSAIQKRSMHDAEQAELARLRQEEAERKQRERDEQIRVEAAAEAKAEAEEKARCAAEAEAARVKAEQVKAEQERACIQREKDDADARARKSEEDRLAAIRKADEDRVIAEAKAKRDAEDAAKREREKIEAERKAEAEAAAKREADKKHRARINNEALEALTTVMTGDGLLSAGAAAKAVVEAIAKGLIPHVKIRY
jgi:hypothetical protein